MGMFLHTKKSCWLPSLMTHLLCYQHNQEAPEKEIICANRGALLWRHPQWERQSADLNPINISSFLSFLIVTFTGKLHGSISHHFQKSLDLSHGHRQGQPEGEQPQLQ